MILSVSNLKKSFGAVEILSGVSFIIEEKEKAAIVGVNGAGKTTILKILTGELEKDEGEVARKKDCVIKYMPQDMTVDSSKTIFEEMLTVFEDVIKLEEDLRSYEAAMTGKEGAELEAVLEKYNKAMHSFEEKNGYEYKSRIRGVIKGLGFSDGFSDISVNNLSGGEKTRVALGKLLLSQPDLLLLDEPTNHLDIDSVRWLENYLQNYGGALVIISHDRYFLDKIVGKVIEIENKKSSVYLGNYTEFSIRKEINREIALRHYLNQQKEIKRQEDIIRTLKSYNRENFFKRAQSREKLLMKIERAEKPEDLPEKIRIILKPRVKSGNNCLTVSGLSKSYGDRVLFKNVSFEIKRGDKVALIGPNGIGKTTLFKILRNITEPDGGKVEFGKNVNIGYYDQEHQDIDAEKSIFDEIYDAYPNLTTTEIRNALAAFVFTGDDAFKKIGALSGGEKGRVALAKIVLGDSNFLLLDEPTNHLDMYSKEILEEALNNYTGTVLYISHDRYFINSTADKVLELKPDGVELYLGNYDYYMEKKQAQSQDSSEAGLPSFPKKGSDKVKNLSQELKRRKNALIKCEADIEKTESEIKEYETELLKKEVYTSPEMSNDIYNKKIVAEERLNKLYLLWEELSPD